MVFSKSRVIGLICTMGALLGALLILHQIAEDDSFVGLATLVDAQLLTILFILYACHFLAEPLRWLAYSRHDTDDTNGSKAGSSRTNFVQIFACFNTTALLSYSLPFKLGLPIRLYLLSHYLALENMSVVKLMALDGMLNLLCWTLIAASLIFVVPGIAALFSPYFAPSLIYPAVVVVLLAGCGLAWNRKHYLLTLLRTVTPNVIALVVVTLAVDVLLYGVRHMVLADALALQIELGITFIIGILATFAGILSTLPMGLGAYDATLVALLALYGVDIELSLMLAVSNRLGMIGTSILLGVPSTFVLVKVDRKIAES